MNDLYKNQYRTISRRLQSWDYSSAGYYFVTICTRNHASFFGKIVGGQTILSQIGKIADEYWRKIPALQTKVEIDQFVIMPNHVHGILIILPNDVSTDANVETFPAVETLQCNVSTAADRMSSISPKRSSLGAVIRSYKSAVTQWGHQNGFPDFAWQARFYDHIIRGEQSLNRIRAYIVDNPAKWHLDRENPEWDGT